MKPYYRTQQGSCFNAESETALLSKELRNYRGKIKLIFTSPPFPLNRKKNYGNLKGKEYVAWLSSFAPMFSEYLARDGSIVLELGNAWNSGKPTYSILPLEALLAFKEVGRFHLCQEFIYYNPARLPSPVQWVNKERIRVKDAFTRLWWLSSTPRPDADNRRILVEYSDRMQRLLKSGTYNAGRRPSQHVIGSQSFLTRNKGAIPPNVIIASNTQSNGKYLSFCRRNKIIPHPARMPEEIPLFFIRFLTKKKDLVLDPFAGSNVTGAVAEKLDRRWLAIEPNRDFAKGSKGRFFILNGSKTK